MFFKEYPYSENQGESFCDPKNLVEDFFVAGSSFVVGDVLKKLPHGSFSPGTVVWRGQRSRAKHNAPMLATGEIPALPANGKALLVPV
ncbi:MAG: hypothetical protein ACLQPN_18550 [Bryobacteraceae bacterium]